jgi:hypothetical protein
MHQKARIKPGRVGPHHHQILQLNAPEPPANAIKAIKIVVLSSQHFLFDCLL